MTATDNTRHRAALFVTILLGGVLPLLCVTTICSYAFSPAPQSPDSEIAVVIPPDASFRSISTILVRNNVIETDIRFRILADLMGVTENLRAGEYIFTSKMSPYQILKKLHQGSMVQRAVTIPEGANLMQISEIFANQGWLKQDYFLSLCHDPAFISTLGLSVKSLEGYLFPDTYLFERGGITAEKIIRIMVARMREVLARNDAMNGIPPEFNLHQLLTLASIVEKETARPTERPLIARVFLNRLRKRMKLQTDPTVIYGLKDFDGNLTRKHLTTPTPYNTYIIKGLPPGPIGSPGENAIRAVLRPAAGSFYYFVSKNDGSHYFSKSLTEHNRAVARYQKRK